MKLRKRLSKLQALKAERASEMVKLVVDCQKLFRQLGLEVTNPLHSKVCIEAAFSFGKPGVICTEKHGDDI